MKGEPGSTALTEEDLNTSCNITVKVNGSMDQLLNAILTLNQTLKSHISPTTISNVNSANWKRIAYFDTIKGDSCPTGHCTVTNNITGQTACGRAANGGCMSLIGNSHPILTTLMCVE